VPKIVFIPSVHIDKYVVLLVLFELTVLPWLMVFPLPFWVLPGVGRRAVIAGGTIPITVPINPIIESQIFVLGLDLFGCSWGIYFSKIIEACGAI